MKISVAIAKKGSYAAIGIYNMNLSGAWKKRDVINMAWKCAADDGLLASGDDMADFDFHINA